MRYENAPDWVQEMVTELRNGHFDELATAKILVVMDSQKTKSRDSIVLGSLKKASSMVNFLSAEAYDYVLLLDREVFMRMDTADRMFLLFHLLCHATKVTEDEEQAFKLVRPDFEVFSKEMEFNSGWQAWWRRMAKFAASCHDASAAKPEVKDPDNPGLYDKQDPDGPGDGEPDREAA